MKSNKKIKKNNLFIKMIKNKYYLYCMLLSTILLLFTSKNSFLYIFNDWVDANAFFTVGKSIMNGVVPYRDLFEQKGLILYLIYGIGYLLSHKTFYGVFILEIISFSVFLYYIHKIFNLYFEKKYSLLLLPIFTFIITTCGSFVHGGSCEEFCFPYLAISLYYFIKHFKIKNLTNKEIIINGIMSGIVFMMKYTIIGFWIGFVIFFLIDYLLKKQIKESFNFVIKFLLGMIIPIGICFMYLLIIGGLKDYIIDYFIINITAYTKKEKLKLIKRIIKIILYSIEGLTKSGYLVLELISLIPFSLLLFKEKKQLKFGFITLFLFTDFFIYCGLQNHRYYALPLTIFIIITLIAVISLLKKYLDKILLKKNITIILTIFLFILSTSLSYNYANYKYFLNYKRKDLFQYKYAKYIMKYDNPTILNMGFLDVGLYTLTGVIPNTKFFEVQNIDYDKFPNNLDDMKYNVENKKVKFIVYVIDKQNETIPGYIYNNYKLVYNDNYMYEYRQINVSLFILKELSTND